MATKYRVQHSFAAGELSQKLHGRFESELYKQGVKTLKNFVPLLQGPAKRRPGTYYAADAEQQAANGSRLVPFYFGEEQSYVLEFSNDKIRFYSQDVQLKYTGAITGITITDGGTGYTAGALVVSNSNSGGTGLAGSYLVDGNGKITNITIDNPGSGYASAPDIDGDAGGTSCVLTPIIHLETTPYVVEGTGYTATEIHEIDWTQSADVLYIVHPNHKPKRLERRIKESGDENYDIRANDNTVWTLVDVDFEDGPWDSINIDNTKTIQVGSDSAAFVEVDGVGIDTATNRFVLYGHGLFNGMKIQFGASVQAISVPTAGVGTGYGTTSGDLAITAGGGTGENFAGTWTSSGGKVVSVALTNGGKGYTSTPTIKATHPSGGTSVEITIDKMGQDNLVTAGSTLDSETEFPSLGTNYYVVNALSSSFQIALDLNGSPLEFKLSIKDKQQITEIEVLEGGAEYKGSEGDGTGTIAVTISGSGTGARATATLSETSTGVVESVAMTDNGHNYGSVTVQIKHDNTDTSNANRREATLAATITNPATTEWGGKLLINKYIIPKDSVCTLTASSAIFVDGTDDVAGKEKLIRINVFGGDEAEKTKGIRWAWFKLIVGGIDQSEAGKKATATNYNEVGLVDTDTREYRFGIFGGEKLWPSVVQIYQQRLVVASTTYHPTTIWCSEAGDFHSFAPDTKIGVSTGDSDSIGQSILGEQILDNNAISLTIDSDTVDSIYWLEEGKKLSLGTSGGIFNLYGSEQLYTISPTNFTIVRATSWEAANIRPVKVGNALLYIQFNRRKLRVMTFSGADVQYESQEISYQADELVGQQLKEISYQKQPHSLTWIILQDGTLASMSYEDTLETVGFGRHTIGGVEGATTFDATNPLIVVVGTDKITLTGHPFITGDWVTYSNNGGTDIGGIENNKNYYIIRIDANTVQLAASYEDAVASTAIAIDLTSVAAGNSAQDLLSASSTINSKYGTQAKVESIAVVPRDGRDQLWMIVHRDSGRYVEFLEKFYEPTEKTQDLAHFVDSGLYKTSITAFTSASGFNHLVGQSLRVLADGAAHPNVTVANDGSIALESSTKSLVAGLPYDSQVTFLPAKQASDGTLFLVGRDRIVKAHMLLHNSLGYKVGLESTADADLEEIIFRLTQNPMGQSVPLFTGTKITNILSAALDEETLKMLCDQPFPLTLIGMISEHEMNI